VISFEGMYSLPKQGVAKALGRPVACHLGAGKEGQSRICTDAAAFCNARSAIIQGRAGEATPFTNSAAFLKGLGLARRSSFKMPRTGLPNDRDKPAAAAM